jgi:hypothetical protein
MDDYMDGYGFGAGISDPSIAGPLIGGGAAQAAALATRLLFKDSKPGLAKWASAIGLGIGGGISAAMMFSPRFRQTGIAGLLTAALVSIPRQVEDLLAGSATMKDYLGLITPERQMAGAFGDDYAMMGGFGEPDVQLLDSGSGSTGVLGTIVPEREMAGANFGGGFGGFGAEGGGDGVELLGFGSNFLSSQ